MANPLHEFGGGCRADSRNHGFTADAIFSIDPDFDQFMMIKCLDDFLHNPWRQAVITDDHNRFAGMSQGFEMAFVQMGESRHEDYRSWPEIPIV